MSVLNADAALTMVALVGFMHALFADRSASLCSSTLVMLYLYIHWAAAYVNLYSSQCSAQYVGLVGSMVEKEKLPQPRCDTSSGR